MSEEIDVGRMMKEIVQGMFLPTDNDYVTRCYEWVKWQMLELIVKLCGARPPAMSTDLMIYVWKALGLPEKYARLLKKLDHERNQISHAKRSHLSQEFIEFVNSIMPEYYKTAKFSIGDKEVAPDQLEAVRVKSYVPSMIMGLATLVGETKISIEPQFAADKSFTTNTKRLYSWVPAIDVDRYMNEGSQ